MTADMATAETASTINSASEVVLKKEPTLLTACFDASPVTWVEEARPITLALKVPSGISRAEKVPSPRVVPEITDPFSSVILTAAPETGNR